MAMDINKFEAVKNKARKMIHDDAKLDSHIIKERQMDRERTYRSLKGSGVAAATGFENIAPSYGSNGASMSRINEEYSDDNDNALYEAMDKQMKQYSMNINQNGHQQPQMQVPTQVNKGLPKEILESFSNNYIDQSVFDPNKSILDKLGIGGDPLQQQNESVQPTRQIPESGGKVDYEIIKGIVEGAVKKYVNALGKKMLTENKSTTLDEINAIQITDKKIAIVTKSGNLYEGKLEFKKNIKSGS